MGGLRGPIEVDLALGVMEEHVLLSVPPTTKRYSPVKLYHERTKEYCVAHGVHPLRFGSDFGGPSRTMGLTPLNALPPKQTHSSTRRLVLLDSWRRNFEQQAAVLGTEDLGNH